MTRKIMMDFTEFNQECKSLGLSPYFLDKVEIDFQDEEHLRLSVKNWEESLRRWLREQDKTRQDDPCKEGGE